MKYISSLPDKFTALQNALLTAREQGEAVVVGEVPKEVRLVCFDMDATLIRMETINRIAQEASIGKRMEELTLRAMSGEDDFRTNFLHRLKMLRGVPWPVVERIAATMPYAQGLGNLMGRLHEAGIETAVITGNFNIFGEYLKRDFGFNHVFTTTPEVEDGTLTGNICGDIIDAPAKSSILIKICSEKNIPLDCTIAVGDGANDIPMLATAAAAVAYNALTAREGIDRVLLPLLHPEN